MSTFFIFAIHRMFDRMVRFEFPSPRSVGCSQAPHTQAHTHTHAFSDLQPDACADAVADPKADPCADPVAHPLADTLADALADPLTDPLTDPQANTIADPTAEARQAALYCAVQGQQLLQGQDGGSDERCQHTQGLPIQRPESGV